MEFVRRSILANYVLWSVAQLMSEWPPTTAHGEIRIQVPWAKMVFKVFIIILKSHN